MPNQPLLCPYWENRTHFSIVDDLLLCDECLVIPKSMRPEILKCIHTGHLGISKCRARARASVWWPGLPMQIENMVTNCSTCAKDRPEPTEPLMSSSFPSRPWERLAADLFELAGKVYLIVVDYYSRWFEISRLNDQSSSRVISVLKELFSTHGIPDIIVSDNGLQFSSDAFCLFTTEYDFIHVTSSPKYRSKQQIYHDKRHQARALPSLTNGQQVWVRDQNREGQILGATKQPRSYLVKTEMNNLQRNRSALVPTSSQPAFPTDGPTMVPQDKTLPVNHTPPRVSTPVSENQPAEPTTPTTCRSTTAVSTQGGPPNGDRSTTECVTRSGRIVKPPQQLDL